MNIPIYHIVGAWRSGTTLLSFILDSHPNIIATHETRFVIRLYNKYHNRTEWNRKEILKFYNDIWNDKNIKYIWPIDKEKVKTDLLDLLDSGNQITLSTLCKTVYLNYESINPKDEIKTIVDKNPRSEERRVGKACRSRWSPYH